MRSFQIAHLFDETMSSIDQIKPVFASVMVNIYRSRRVKSEDKKDLMDKLSSLEDNIVTIKNMLKES
jgi:hypothetical protein